MSVALTPGLTCPSCGQVDLVRKVTAVYSEGTSAGTSTGSVSAFTVANGGAAFTNGGTGGRHHTQTLLSSRLTPPSSPPPAPARPSLGSDARYLQFIVAIGGLAATVVTVGTGGYMLATGQNSADAFTLLAFGVTAPIGTVFLSRRLTMEAQRAQRQFPIALATHQRQLAAYEDGTSNWNKAMYCGRCDGVFLPGYEVVPLDEARHGGWSSARLQALDEKLSLTAHIQEVPLPGG